MREDPRRLEERRGSREPLLCGVTYHLHIKGSRLVIIHDDELAFSKWPVWQVSRCWVRAAPPPGNVGICCLVALSQLHVFCYLLRAPGAACMCYRPAHSLGNRSRSRGRAGTKGK